MAVQSDCRFAPVSIGSGGLQLAPVFFGPGAFATQTNGRREFRLPSFFLCKQSEMRNGQTAKAKRMADATKTVSVKATEKGRSQAKTCGNPFRKAHQKTPIHAESRSSKGAAKPVHAAFQLPPFRRRAHTSPPPCFLHAPAQVDAVQHRLYSFRPFCLSASPTRPASTAKRMRPQALSGLPVLAHAKNTAQHVHTAWHARPFSCARTRLHPRVSFMHPLKSTPFRIGGTVFASFAYPQTTCARHSSHGSGSIHKTNQYPHASSMPPPSFLRHTSVPPPFSLHTSAFAFAIP